MSWLDASVMPRDAAGREAVEDRLVFGQGDDLGRLVERAEVDVGSTPPDVFELGPGQDEGDAQLDEGQDASRPDPQTRTGAIGGGGRPAQVVGGVGPAGGTGEIDQPSGGQVGAEPGLSLVGDLGPRRIRQGRQFAEQMVHEADPTRPARHPSIRTGRNDWRVPTSGRGRLMDDAQLVERIDGLVAEEHALEREHIGEMDDKTRARLDAIGVQLDQCWDLLRQRRARRHAGLDPDTAAPRSADVVEKYVQ